jgi:sugar lactone lactonase YvrE
VAFAVLTGCSSAPPPAAPAPVRVFPTPPDSPRIQFFARFSASTDVEESASPGFFDRLVGEESAPDDADVLQKPYGVAVLDGVIYVCDSRRLAIVLLDLRSRSWEPWTPTDAGTLRKPINCTVDPTDGRLFVVDTDRGEVVVFGRERRFVGAFARQADSRPTDVFVDDSLAWVTDLNRQDVTAYDRMSFQQVRSFPAPERADSASRLFGPMGVWATEDEIYVSDFGAMRVQVYARDGEHLRTVGQFGRSPGSFVRPKGIAVDREGILYAVDAAFDNVQMFDPEGRLLMAFGGPYARPGDMNLPAQVTLDYANVDLFEDRVREGYDLAYLVIVTNQLGPDFVNVYGRIVPREAMP